MIAPIVEQAKPEPSARPASYVNVTHSNTFPGAGPVQMTRPALSEAERIYRLLRVCGMATAVYLLVVAARLLTLNAAPSQEGASYLYQAQHLEYYLRADSTTNGLAYHNPGFPILVRALMLLFHNPLWAAKAAILLIVAGYLAVTWRLLHIWFAPRAARVAYLLGLCLLPLLETLTAIRSDAGAALFALTGMLLLHAQKAGGDAKWRREEQSGEQAGTEPQGIETDAEGDETPAGTISALAMRFSSPLWVAFATGLLFGGAYLFQSMYKLLPAVVLGAWLLFDPAHIRDKASRCGALAFGFGMVFFAWAVCCKLGRGEWFPERSHALMVWKALDHSGSWMHLGDYANKYPTLSAAFRHQGGPLLRAWGRTLYHAPTDFLLSTFTLSALLMPLGLFLYMKQLNLARLQFLAFAAALTAFSAFFWLETRTLLPLIFWLLGLSSLAAQSEFVPLRLDDLYEDGGWLWRGLARAYLRPVVVGAMFTAFLAPLLYAQPWKYQPSAIDVETARAGQALRAISKRNETLAASVYSIGQAADVHTVNLYQLLPRDARFNDNLLLRVLATHANYLAYVEGPSNGEYPDLNFLLTPRDPRVPANFELVYQNDAQPHVVIYRIHWWIWAQKRQASQKVKNRDLQASSPHRKETDPEWR